jgi:mRNA interferase RelE/StbE
VKVQFRRSFTKDLRNVRDRRTLVKVQSLVGLIENARTLDEVPNLTRLAGGKSYYRLRVGSFRLGLVVEGDMVTFVRFLHRKEIYRFFP